MTSPAERPSGEEGFTLLEVTVVLVIAGLLLAVALERGPLRSTTVTFGAARARIVHILRDAEAQARTTGLPVTVMLDAATRDVTIRSGAVTRHDRLAGPVQILMPRPAGPPLTRGLFRFDPDGTALGPPLALLLGSLGAVVSVSPVTGRIETHAP